MTEDIIEIPSWPDSPITRGRWPIAPQFTHNWTQKYHIWRVTTRREGTRF